MQSLAQSRFFSQPRHPSLHSPPYLTAEPVITTTRIEPRNNDFVILASDGLWDHLSSEQAVELVGSWLMKNNPANRIQPIDLSKLFLEDKTEINGTEKRHRTPPPAGTSTWKSYTNARSSRNQWIVKDENAATHLVRNALGGADEDMLAGRLEVTNESTVRRRRGDMTVQVLFFGHDDSTPPDPRLVGNEAKPKHPLSAWFSLPNNVVP